MSKYIIALSYEGDFFVSLGDNSFKSTYISQEIPTIFDTKEEAEQTIIDLSLKFVWPDVHIEVYQ